MARFKCRLSGNVFEFTNDYDIADMREHPQYDEVKEIPDGVPIKDRNYSADANSTSVQVKKTTKEKVIKKDKQ